MILRPLSCQVSPLRIVKQLTIEIRSCSLTGEITTFSSVSRLFPSIWSVIFRFTRARWNLLNCSQEQGEIISCLSMPSVEMPTSDENVIDILVTRRATTKDASRTEKWRASSSCRVSLNQNVKNNTSIVFIAITCSPADRRSLINSGKCAGDKQLSSPSHSDGANKVLIHEIKPFCFYEWPN